ncbi:hypothetical protein GCM10009760_37460 [Kitasatospora kazusensis]|uniref:Uncharacterized protein n=1 Tax=Kitasatospora kazusensis TaxID=407974 RepID=A0ABP5LGY1_9ACTN
MGQLAELELELLALVPELPDPLVEAAAGAAAAAEPEEDDPEAVTELVEEERLSVR